MSDEACQRAGGLSPLGDCRRFFQPGGRDLGGGPTVQAGRFRTIVVVGVAAVVLATLFVMPIGLDRDVDARAATGSSCSAMYKPLHC